ncbi:DNA-binding domain-containing protein [Clostridium pasteurianum]|uniref:DNA-binding domain-containing protein n=1 Tax=Clostridium pasteurianum TaxID=1501 RepID=UPI00311A65C7
MLPNFFDFTEVRKKMMELENEILNSHIRINTKKFIKVLYMESKKTYRSFIAIL